MKKRRRRALRRAAIFVSFIGLAACDTAGGFSGSGDPLSAPGVDLRAEARNEGVDPGEVGHRLVSSGEYELAIKAFNRAALDRGGYDAELLSGLGTANLGLGRLGQAEKFMRRAVAQDDAEPVDYNNLGVVLMETGKSIEAVQYFKRGFALSDGENIEIRDNLRLALAKSENSAITEPQPSSDFKVVRRGNTQFVIRKTP